MTVLDRRLNAFRADLADARLKGSVAAERFVAGAPMRIAVPAADLLQAPGPMSGLGTQLLLGAQIAVFDVHAGFAWVQSMADGYVGYVSEAGIGASGPEPTHVVAAPRSFVYAAPDMKHPRTRALSMGCGVSVEGEAETRGTRYLMLAGGEAVVARHFRPVGEVSGDFVAVAEQFEHTPYLWGGASAFGIDCSGLVQLALRMAGRSVLRDTDMQAASIGEARPFPDDLSGLRRGDLVFWKGHVAIMTDPETIIHANGHTMSVARESLRGAVERIGYLYGGPTGVRRP